MKNYLNNIFFYFEKNLYSNSLILNKYRFIICYFGKKELINSNYIKRYLVSLCSTIPKSIVVIAVSIYTSVDPKLFNYYNLELHIERYGNETISSITQKYGKASVHYYFSGIRFIFYTKYFSSHPEVEYALFTDVDSLILQDPFELLRNNSYEVHVMYDIYPFSKHDDFNYVWMKAWALLSSSKKSSCGMFILNRSIDCSEIENIIPWNSGLMMGNCKNLLLICNLMATMFSCIGMFDHNAEQGLLNYLRISGQIETLGIRFHAHTVQTGNFVSCPDLITLKNFKERIKSNEIYILHHYNHLKRAYINSADDKIKYLLSLK